VSEVNHSKRLHALCSASSSERWLSCPGSVFLSIQVPEPEASAAALEGTRAHELSERILHRWHKNGFAITDDEIAEVSQGHEEEMVSNVLQYVQVCMDEVAQFDAEPIVRIEQRLTFSEEMQMFGTADFIATGRRDGISTGVIVDLKYGRGKRVQTQDNSQLAYYAVALKLCSRKNLERVKVRVVQPRMGEIDGHQWFDAEALAHWELKLTLGAENALMMAGKAKKPTYNEGSWCWFCPGKTICPEIEAKVHAKLIDSFGELPSSEKDDSGF